MNNKLSVKFLSLLLAVIMLLGCFSFSVFADEEVVGTDEVSDEVVDEDASEETDSEDEEAAEGEEGTETDGAEASGEEEEVVLDETEAKAAQYLTTVYATPQEKLATMECKVTVNGYELWCDSFSGEVALVNTVTGQTLFTNPYDIGSSIGSKDVKGELMSQLMIQFTDNTGTATSYNSYVWSTSKGQIKTKSLKGGLRVEYSIGEEETRYLVPMVIEKTRYEELLLAAAQENGISNYKLNKLSYYYVLMDPENPELTDAEIADMYRNYPITEKMAVYVFDTTAARREYKEIEGIIKQFCPKYTYAMMEEDHQMTGYISTAEAPPLFMMALEYYLDEEGLQIRLPANGVRFDEDKYQLNYIRILPYFGAGNSANEGYVFVPDGSGALLDFKKLEEARIEDGISGDLYGTDFAYHEIVTTNLEQMSLPVFGVVENFNPITQEAPPVEEPVEGEEGAEGEESAEGEEPSEGEETDENAEDLPEDETKEETKEDAKEEPKEDVAEEDTKEATDDADGEATEEPKEDGAEEGTEGSTEEDAEETPEAPVVTGEPEDRGFLAIIEEGDSLATLISTHGGTKHRYNSVYPEFYLRPSDSYNLSDAVSVGDDTVWTISADRKYTGSYSMRIVMLTDEAKAAKAGLSEDEYYEVSYVGMAKAYQDYLVEKEVLTFIEEEKEDIPLYIESFGTMDTDSTFLSIPVTVTEALTTFDNLKTMHEELVEAGVNNVNFRLTGFANGGMISSVPTKVKFQKEVGGNEGYSEFLKYAGENNITVFPDFNFSYANKDESFDGFSFRNDAVRTIDNRYTQKREYYSSLQQSITTGLICISPSVFDKFYTKVEEDLSELGKSGISLGTLGSDLNSDFDEDDSYTREDSKELVQALLEKANNDFDSVMIDKGNAYTWKYADTILNLSLDSSRHSNASRSIPFIGMVLHGCVEFTGSPTNMASDMDYEALKMIENGAAPYFTLSYDNTAMLKDDNTLSKYYSVAYDIWFDDLVQVYNELNSVLKGVQNTTIKNHEFLSGVRVKDEVAVADEAAVVEGTDTTDAPVEENVHVVDDGTIVRVTYANGTTFILNYNRFAVEVEGQTIDAVSYLQIN